MVQPRQEIPITETWARHDWSNFDTYQPLTNNTGFGRNGDGSFSFSFGLSSQNHVDLRTFTEGAWTGGMTTGYIATLNNWPGGTVNLTTGTTTLTSKYVAPIDLTVLGSDALLSLALPNSPSALDINNSFLDLSSDGFNQSICSLAFNATSHIIHPGSSATLTWDYANLTGIDLTNVTGVRFRIAVTSNSTLYLMALRLTGPNWTPTSVDFDSLNNRLVQCIPISGDPATASVQENRVLPPLWRSASIAGVDDPRPVNAEMSFLFNTGSQTQGNSFTLYMRERNEAFITQLDLQGVTQLSLSGQPQPTEGISTRSPRTMSDLDQDAVGGLDDQTMINLEAVNNPVYSSWVSFMIAWGQSNLVQITNSASPNGGYRYSSGLSLTNNTTYLCICKLTNTTAQLQIYNVDQTTLAIGSPVFDTTTITDSFLFPRQSGRIGFQAILQDGDAYIGALRPRSLTFAEYRSAVFNSFTPVKGARLYVHASPDTSLFTGWSPQLDAGGNTPVISSDQQRYITAHPDRVSTQVVVTQPSSSTPAQGIISNLLSPSDDALSGITDFNQLHLSFSLWVSSAAMSAPTLSRKPILTAALISSTGNVIPVNLPALTPDQWQSVEIMQPVTTTPLPQSGLYQLALYYNSTVPSTWWVDAVNLREHAIRWDARSVADDAWHSNYAPWTFFHDTMNSDTSGVLFTTMGTQLQMRALARKQSATILSPPNLVPVYAELGNLVWPEDNLVNTGRPSALISAANVGRTYTFNGTSSTSPNDGPVLDYQWSFGDGTADSGGVVQHTYAPWLPPGTAYFVELTIIDSAGRSALTSTIVTL